MRLLGFKKEMKEKQKCPNCGHLIGVVAGSKEAICKNCGFKDPCCE
jgi:ribosomal protein L32